MLAPQNSKNKENNKMLIVKPKRENSQESTLIPLKDVIERAGFTQKHQFKQWSIEDLELLQKLLNTQPREPKATDYLKRHFLARFQAFFEAQHLYSSILDFHKIKLAEKILKGLNGQGKGKGEVNEEDNGAGLTKNLSFKTGGKVGGQEVSGGFRGDGGLASSVYTQKSLLRSVRIDQKTAKKAAKEMVSINQKLSKIESSRVPEHIKFMAKMHLSKFFIKNSRKRLDQAKEFINQPIRTKTDFLRFAALPRGRNTKKSPESPMKAIKRAERVPEQPEIGLRVKTTNTNQKLIRGQEGLIVGQFYQFRSPESDGSSLDSDQKFFVSGSKIGNINPFSTEGEPELSRYVVAKPKKVESRLIGQGEGPEAWSSFWGQGRQLADSDEVLRNPFESEMVPVAPQPQKMSKEDRKNDYFGQMINELKTAGKASLRGQMGTTKLESFMVSNQTELDLFLATVTDETQNLTDFIFKHFKEFKLKAELNYYDTDELSRLRSNLRAQTVSERASMRLKLTKSCVGVDIENLIKINFLNKIQLIRRNGNLKDLKETHLASINTNFDKVIRPILGYLKKARIWQSVVKNVSTLSRLMSKRLKNIENLSKVPYCMQIPNLVENASRHQIEFLRSGKGLILSQKNLQTTRLDPRRLLTASEFFYTKKIGQSSFFSCLPGSSGDPGSHPPSYKLIRRNIFRLNHLNLRVARFANFGHFCFIFAYYEPNFFKRTHGLTIYDKRTKKVVYCNKDRYKPSNYALFDGLEVIKTSKGVVFFSKGRMCPIRDYAIWEVVFNPRKAQTTAWGQNYRLQGNMEQNEGSSQGLLSEALIEEAKRDPECLVVSEASQTPLFLVDNILKKIPMRLREVMAFPDYSGPLVLFGYLFESRNARFKLYVYLEKGSRNLNFYKHYCGEKGRGEEERGGEGLRHQVYSLENFFEADIQNEVYFYRNNSYSYIVAVFECRSVRGGSMISRVRLDSDLLAKFNIKGF